MNDNLKISRRQVLVWTTPVVAAVALPAHAGTSELICSFSVDKTQTGGPNPVVAVGDVIEYTITVTNTGEVDLSGVVVNDTLPDGTPATLSAVTESMTADGVLQVGENWTYTTSYTVVLTDLSNGTDLVNTVTVQVDELTEPVIDTETTSVTQLCTCEGPPVLSVLAEPKCSGNPPVGTAVIEITAAGECPMTIKGIEVTTDDPKSDLGSFPTFPIDITESSGETITWIGPASDSLNCLALASISIEIEYCCEDGVILTETYDITQLLVDSAP